MSVSVSVSVVSTIEFEGHILGDFQIIKACTTCSYSMLWLCHQGGFDAHFVQHLFDQCPSLICLICHLAAREPILIKCDHLICQECLGP